MEAANDDSPELDFGVFWFERSDGTAVIVDIDDPAYIYNRTGDDLFRRPKGADERQTERYEVGAGWRPVDWPP